MITDVSKIRRKILTEVAALALNDELKDKVDQLPNKLVSESTVKFGCCEYKEKAIIKDRIKLAMGFDARDSEDDDHLSDLLKKDAKISLKPEEGRLVTILEKACDGCPIDTILVTDACRNCSAHKCVNACPRHAIEIVGDRAFIIKEKCVECGLCAKACPFHAIVELERPCMKACGTGALAPCSESTACIDYDKCVDCGACMQACPFGAISDRSQLTAVIKMLKDPTKFTVALIAPAFVGQFGPLVEWSQLVLGLQRIGFSAVMPVAKGADAVALAESAEIMEHVAAGKKNTFNSCCPAFKKLINTQHVSLSDHVSSTPSPMVVSAQMAKDIYADHGDVGCVFIGPCIAKKGEAVREAQGVVDQVLTFEELTSLLVAAEINLAKLDKNVKQVDEHEASTYAQKFCQAGGVTDAVKHAIAEKEDSQTDLNTMRVEGIKQCKGILQAVEKGKINVDFIEGMGCEGGCLGGPGNLVDIKRAANALKRLTK